MNHVLVLMATLVGAAAGVGYVALRWDAEALGAPVMMLMGGAVGGTAGLLVGCALVMDALSQRRVRFGSRNRVRGRSVSPFTVLLALLVVGGAALAAAVYGGWFA